MTINFFAAAPHTRLTIATRWDRLPPDETDTGLFGAFQFGFVGGSGGYMGLQSRGKRRMAIFSVWDHPSQVGSAVPLSLWGVRFGGEGEGAKCLRDFPWQLQRWYKFDMTLDVPDVIGYAARARIVFWPGKSLELGTIQLTKAYGDQLSTWAGAWNEQWAGPLWHCQRPRSIMCWRPPRYFGSQGAPIALARANTVYATSTCEDWRRRKDTTREGFYLVGDNGAGVVQRHPAGEVTL